MSLDPNVALRLSSGLERVAGVTTYSVGGEGLSRLHAAGELSLSRVHGIGVLGSGHCDVVMDVFCVGGSLSSV